MTRSIKECDLTALAANGVSTDVLGDTAGLALNNGRGTDLVEEGCFTMVNVTHNDHDRRTRFHVLLFIFALIEEDIFLGDLHDRLCGDAVLAGNKSSCIVIEFLVKCNQHTHHHKCLNDVCRSLSETVSKILDRNERRELYMCQLRLDDRCRHERLALHLLLALAAHVHRIQSLIIGEDIGSVTGELVGTLISGTAVIVDSRLLVILLGIRLRILSVLLVCITSCEVCLLLCCLRRELLLRLGRSLRLVSVIVVNIVVVLILRRESAAKAAVAASLAIESAIVRTSALGSVRMIGRSGSWSPLISAGTCAILLAYECRRLTGISGRRCFYYSRRKLRSFLRCFRRFRLRFFLRRFLRLFFFFLYRFSRFRLRFRFLFCRRRCRSSLLLFRLLFLYSFCCFLRGFFRFRSCLLRSFSNNRLFNRSLFYRSFLLNRLDLFLRCLLAFLNRRFLGLLVYTTDSKGLRT